MVKIINEDNYTPPNKEEIERKRKEQIIEEEKVTSNRDLLDYVISMPGYLDKSYDPLDDWEFDYLKKKLYERLADWLEM